jgi:thiol-disulfide isomerase/thioredoxin
MHRMRRIFSSVIVVAAMLGAGGGSVPARGPMSAVPVEKASGSTPALSPATSKQVHDEVLRPGATAVLVNVWATWCIPCREEFPDLMRVYRELESRGLRLVLVSADFEDDREAQVGKFLKGQGVSFPSFLKQEKDESFIDGIDPEWSGVMPVSLLYDGSGKRRNFWEGSASYAEIRERVLEVLDHPASNSRKTEEVQPKEAR